MRDRDDDVVAFACSVDPSAESARSRRLEVHFVTFAPGGRSSSPFYAERQIDRVVGTNNPSLYRSPSD